MIEFAVYFKCPITKIKEDLFGLLQIQNGNHPEKNIPILCNIEIPKLLCLKQVYSESKLPLLSLMLELKTKGQKFRVPFKNASCKDMEIDFSLDTINNNSIFTVKDNVYDCQFMLFPNKLNIQPGSTQSIDIIAKIRKVKSDENQNMDKYQNKVRKIIIAKLQNSDVFYSFFTEAQIKL